GHPARHFNVGQYRRIQCEGLPFQDAHFFDPGNPEGQEARNRALCAALDDVEAWLVTDEAQVAMVDATNSTEARRQQLIQRFRGRWDYIFVESVCNDREVLERNYKLKLLYSPDYAGMEPERALQDFRDRISKYEAAYETIANRSIHYIKLIDMVTGRGHMDVNRISGYLPGKMVMYLMQICRALGQRRRIWLTRHGESEFNMLGKIGGNAGLSSRGAVYAALLPQILLDRVPAAPEGAREPVAVWTSTLARTIMTAARLPFPKVQWKALDEIQSGICDGMTYDEIRARLPGEFELRRRDKLRYRYPSGESYMDVVQRLEPVVTELESERDCVCIVSHQAVLRVLYGYFMNRPLEEVPTLEIPLHTIIELTPQPDGTMAEAQFQVDVDLAMRSKALLSELFSA
ncbi:6-phosphofructo-2-kinase, partial [Helicosporidium sp. ATCC 50920]